MNRLLIDLDICSKCDECGSLCSYREHPHNNGIMSIRELAHFSVICRRCSDAPCVAACPMSALEKQADGKLKRYLMRCTSCKSCSRACPFGTIYSDTIPFIASRCDACIGRLNNGSNPICLDSCQAGGISFGNFDENREANMFKISENIIVKTSLKWERELPQSQKR